MPIRTGNSQRTLRSHRRVDRALRRDERGTHTVAGVLEHDQPPCAPIALRNTSSWAASAVRMPSASASHRRVEPSTSVNKNVTTPEGAAAAGADTPAESHNRHAPTSHIGGIRPDPAARRGVARYPLAGSQRRYGPCWLASGMTRYRRERQWAGRVT